MLSELDRLRHYYLASAGHATTDAIGAHPMQKLVPRKTSIRAPVDDEDEIRAMLEEKNETAFKRHRAHGRRLDLAIDIQRKAQHTAVESERAILEGYHRSAHPFMPLHVTERLREISHLLGPPTQDRYPAAAAV